MKKGYQHKNGNFQVAGTIGSFNPAGYDPEVNARIDFITENISDLFVEVGRDDRIVYLNKTVEIMLGYTRDSLLGIKLRIPFSDTERPTPSQLFKENPRVKCLQREVLLRTVDGCEVLLDVSFKPVFDQSGNYTGSVMTGHNITARRSTELALRKSEERYKKLTEILADGASCSLLNEDGSFHREWYTENLVGFLKYPYDNIKSLEDWKKIIVEEDRDMFDERMSRVAAGETVVFDVRIKDIDDTTRWFTINVAPEIGRPGERSFKIYSAMKEITERKRDEELLIRTNERLKELNASKDKFFSIIAHDLKNPVSSFRSLTNILRDELEDLTIRELNDLVGHMSDAAGNLYRLLNDLLLWSKSQAGQIAFNPETVKLYDLVNIISQSFVQAIAGKKIDFSVDIDRDIYCRGDVNMLMTIIGNFLANAIKYTEKEGKVTVSGRRIEEAVEVSVEDTGVGISKENLEKLYDITQSHAMPGTDNEIGSGLGLILCKEFVERHGGVIFTESTVGKGSKFRFVIPD